MRRGQSWSIDLVLSLVLFVGAMLLAYTLVTNTLQDRGYEESKISASNAASLIVTDGYPQHWSASSVIRAGLAADGHLSLRKARELANLTPTQLRSSLRMDYPVLLYIVNASGNVTPVFGGECGVGDVAMTSTPAQRTLPAYAIAPETIDFVDSIANVTVYADDTVYKKILGADVLIIEGNLTSSLASNEIASRFESASRRGGEMFFIGYPGIAMLGIEMNLSNASSIQTIGSAGAEIGFDDNHFVDVRIGASEQEIPSIELSTDPKVSNFVSVATTDKGKIAIATWTYNDAKIWYVATIEGFDLSATNITAIMAPSIQEHVNVSWPECDEPQPPASAKNIAHHERILPYHDELLTLRIVSWRNS